MKPRFRWVITAYVGGWLLLTWQTISKPFIPWGCVNLIITVTAGALIIGGLLKGWITP